MIRITAGTICLLQVGVLGQPSYGQEAHPSQGAHKLKMAWAELQRKPDDSIVQEQYLTVFPRTYKNCIALFGVNRELYDDGHEYIAILPTLAMSHEEEVGRLLVRLCEDAQYDADAPSYLQHAMAAYSAQHTLMFATVIEHVPPEKQAHVIDFMADVDAPAAYPEYQIIVDHLKTLGYNDVARKLESTREKRSSRQHR